VTFWAVCDVNITHVCPRNFVEGFKAHSHIRCALLRGALLCIAARFGSKNGLRVFLLRSSQPSTYTPLSPTTITVEHCVSTARFPRELCLTGFLQFYSATCYGRKPLKLSVAGCYYPVDLSIYRQCFCQVRNARTISPIFCWPNFTKFEYNTSIDVAIKTLGTEFWKFYRKGRQCL